MKRLLEGYAKFRREAFEPRKDHFHLLSEIQSPEVLFITCADSRIVPDLILQTEPGDLFICRVVGNVVPPAGELPGGVSSTIEYAVEVLKVRHVIVCGHSDCGAAKAALNRDSLQRLPLTEKWLRYIESAWNYLDPGVSRDDPKALHTALIHANVIAQMENLKTHPEIARGLTYGTIQVHGWYYDILTGTIEAWDQKARRFVPLEEFVLPEEAILAPRS
ncbi:carbonic anhydrase [Paracidobacterium acidisoli]|uniref:Carbonic anhydrase n=1 Tax=Paracidobacterium acidisoli TaxID=2303751 RepID=A0A372IP72_9BACT|nr:carbonic anhydrase [Paracidobacterium acidisoli]MBT9331004.1 carbonic anhydrase [Paracidobacterium acidisoli]